MSFPDFVGMTSNRKRSEVSRIVSLNFDGLLNADASGINSIEVAWFNAALRTTIVSLTGFSAIVGCVPHEKRDNRCSKMSNLSDVIELRLTFIGLAFGGEFIGRPADSRSQIELLMMKLRTNDDLNYSDRTKADSDLLMRIYCRAPLMPNRCKLHVLACHTTDIQNQIQTLSACCR
jgi:hypothetical protein